MLALSEKNVFGTVLEFFPSDFRSGKSGFSI
jgi:hypothetical protein